MNLLLYQLKVLFPTANPMDFGLRCDLDQVVRIDPTMWKVASPIPSQAELDAVKTQAETSQANAETEAKEIAAMGKSEDILAAIKANALGNSTKLDAIVTKINAGAQQMEP